MCVRATRWTNRGQRRIIRPGDIGRAQVGESIERLVAPRGGHYRDTLVAVRPTASTRNLDSLSTRSERDRLPRRDKLADAPSNSARWTRARSSMNAVGQYGSVRIAIIAWVVVCACWVSAESQAPP